VRETNVSHMLASSLTAEKPNSFPDLFIIGLGVTIPGHITQQATRAMSQCSRLYTLIREASSIWLPPGKSKTIEVIDILKWYIEGSLRTHNYDHVARAIARTLHRGECAGYVTYGNPMSYDSVAENLIQLATDAGFSVQVIPGISSLESILCDLRKDMAPGIQIMDASWLVACQIRPRIDVPLLLMQIGAFGSLRTHYTRRQDGSSLNELVQYLGRIYPGSHPIQLIRSTGNDNQKSHIRKLPLADLGKATAEDISGASLYIQPAQEAHIDKEIVVGMERT